MSALIRTLCRWCYGSAGPLASEIPDYYARKDIEKRLEALALNIELMERDQRRYEEERQRRGVERPGEA